MEEQYRLPGIDIVEPLISDGGAGSTPSVEAIVHALTYIEQGKAPRRALTAALGMREALLPRLVDELGLPPIDVAERHADAPEETTYYLHELAMHLMAAWRAPQGWALVLDFFVSDCDLAMELSDFGGEAFLPGILVRCYDGSDLAYLERVIETEALDVIFRQACIRAYHGLVLSGRVPAERFVGFLARLLGELDGGQADGWADWLTFRAAEVQAPALRPLIEGVIARGLTQPGDSMLCLVSGPILAQIYAADPAAISAGLLLDAHFDDLVENVCRWGWFNEMDHAERPATLPWSASASIG